MLTKRIIACLDMKNGRIVKGVQFEGLIDGGDPVEASQRYAKEGIDEIVLLDITASHEKREIIKDIVKKVASVLFIPFSVGGGISSLEDVYNILRLGADKVSLNTSAISNPDLITQTANRFGSQCVVVAIDTKKDHDMYRVYTHGGRHETELDAIEWARRAESLGAGEILLTSMDRDGVQKGFDTDLLKSVSESVNIPVIASGGAGCKKDFYEAFVLGKVDAVLAASVFHFKKISISELKQDLMDRNIPMRIHSSYH